jgi:hypothetical protein
MLAGALIKAPAGEIAAADVLEPIIIAMAETPAGDHPGHPRRAHIR